jgi:molybdate transport system ATP-binding protein
VSLSASIEVRLDGLHLDVRLGVSTGETLVVLGPNGAGKTTLLRCLAGLLPLRGRVVLDGETLEDSDAGVRVPTERRPIGFVFQDYLLFPRMSVEDNVAFGLRARGAGKETSRREARAWLERVGLGDKAAARPSALSGGQAQRVALARALAISPRLLLLDEPLAALDAGARGEVRRELRRHLSSFPGTRLLVTHDPVEAVALGDRLVVIEDGRVVQEGAPEELRRRPRSPYVATLVGLNLARGRADGDVVELASGAVLTAAARAKGDVLVALPPRAIALYRSRPEGSPRNVWRARVEALDVGRESVRVHLGDPLPVVAEVTAAALADLEVRAGDELWASVKASEVELYPA